MGKVYNWSRKALRLKHEASLLEHQITSEITDQSFDFHFRKVEEALEAIFKLLRPSP